MYLSYNSFRLTLLNNRKIPSKRFFSSTLTWEQAAKQTPYLSGNFAPIHKEIEVKDLKVEGTIPDDLKGIFTRIGPNPKYPPIGEHHWFDGDGMLHAIFIQNGKANYKNKYIRTLKYKQEEKAGRALTQGIIEFPKRENLPNILLDKFKTKLRLVEPRTMRNNAANTATLFHHNKLFALWEGGSPYEINPYNLDTIGPVTFGGKPSSSFTAHPKVDPKTGEVIFIGYNFESNPYVRYGILNPDGSIKSEMGINLDAPVMMHDFAISEHYSIIMNLPLTFSIERIKQGKPAILFEKNLPSKFGIFPRYAKSSTEIKWFEAPPCFMFHTLNSFEEGDSVILYGCKSNSTIMLQEETDTNESKSELFRWEFNLKTGTTKIKQMDDHKTEFPTMDSRKLGSKSEIGFSSKQLDNNFLPKSDGIMKHNLKHEKNETLIFGDQIYGGEAIFVPKTGSTKEDDGYLLCLTSNEKNINEAELQIIPAQEFKEPIAKIKIPTRVPYGFHANWITPKGSLL